MFGLFYGCFSAMFTSRERGVLILGLESSGKTTLLEQMKAVYNNNSNTRGRLESTPMSPIRGGSPAAPPVPDSPGQLKRMRVDAAKIQPTVGCNVGRLSVPGARVIVWDLGGRNELRPIWCKYYEDAEALIFCVDGSDQFNKTHGWEESRDVLRELLREPSLRAVPILVCVTKSDAWPSHRMDLELKTYFDGLGGSRVHYVSFSGLAEHHSSDHSFDDGLRWLISSLDDG